MFHWKPIQFGILMLWTSIGSTQTITLTLEEYATDLRSPVGGAHAGDGTKRLFILEQPGQVRVIENGVLLPEPFLDVSDKMVRLNSGYDERGLLGIAFHPKYKENGLFYVYYSAPGGPGNHESHVSEFVVSVTNTNAADPNSERILLTIPQPESNHNGGQLAFGPDGMLYIGLGDGGGGGDQHGRIGNGQNMETLLGKILRINVDEGDPYGIPPDNPFVGRDGLDEIWAYGFRNPWRFSFDRRGKHQLFAGDVGQNQWEEVDIVERGGNYGWRIMEGTHCFNPRNCDPTGLELPIAEYDHDVGISITGGYVYRGYRFSSLYGKYVFGDYNGRLFFLTQDTAGEWSINDFIITDRDDSTLDRPLAAFAEGEEGELYVLSPASSSPTARGGIVYRIHVTSDQSSVSQPWNLYR